MKPTPVEGFLKLDSEPVPGLPAPPQPLVQRPDPLARVIAVRLSRDESPRAHVGAYVDADRCTDGNAIDPREQLGGAVLSFWRIDVPVDVTEPWLEDHRVGRKGIPLRLALVLAEEPVPHVGEQLEGLLVREVPLDLRQEDHVARVEAEPGHTKPLLIVLMKQAGEDGLAAHGHGELEILAHGNALDLEVNGVRVVVEPNVALTDLVLGGGLEEHEPKAGHLRDEGEVGASGGGAVPVLGSGGGGNEKQSENS